MDAKQVAVMRVVDGLWETYEWVPMEVVEDRVSYSPRQVRQVVGALEKLGFVSWVGKGRMGEPSVKLKERGKDALAVWDFRKHGVIDDIGHVVGEGKEAKLVLGFKDGEKVALKLHRYYSAEFNKIKTSMAYTALKWWKQKVGRTERPVVVERAKAQIEFRALEKLHRKVSVPRPLGINRHVVAMEFIGNDLPAPLMHEFKRGKTKFAKEVSGEYEKAVDAGIVHGDLSEYNVMIWDGRPWLIDWPQAVPVDFPGAKKLLERDRKNIENLFV